MTPRRFREAAGMSLRARLTIDLDAIVANWRALDALTAPGCETAAVVKADAYGCGAAQVGQALARAGARTFFVAVALEGERLRAAIGPDPAIYVLGGYARETVARYAAHELRPVLNSAAQARAWFADRPGAPAAVQIDTGMNRLGMEADEVAALGPLPDAVVLVMSHMGCADEPAHPLNAAQLAEFRRLTGGLGRPRSLSATAGLLLGTDWHFDLTRPGIGLYGGWPFAQARPVVRLEAPIIQVRDLAPGERVGYAAAWEAGRPSRIATIGLGYADGLIRAAGACGAAWIAGRRVLFAGRVSMDLITLDVSDVPCAPGDMVELLGPHQGIDDVARMAGTIGHEVLTSLGARFEWTYAGGIDCA
jgi:alanine racemase